MNNHLNPAKTGIAVGAFVGVMHIIWSLLVALGWAAPLVNFSLWAHMVNAEASVNPFDFSAAITVVIVAAIVGYLIGQIFSRVWNWTHRA